MAELIPPLLFLAVVTALAFMMFQKRRLPECEDGEPVRETPETRARKHQE